MYKDRCQPSTLANHLYWLKLVLIDACQDQCKLCNTALFRSRPQHHHYKGVGRFTVFSNTRKSYDPSDAVPLQKPHSSYTTGIFSSRCVSGNTTARLISIVAVSIWKRCIRAPLPQLSLFRLAPFLLIHSYGEPLSLCHPNAVLISPPFFQQSRRRIANTLYERPLLLRLGHLPIGFAPVWLDFRAVSGGLRVLPRERHIKSFLRPVVELRRSIPRATGILQWR
jgi:hypothetical protein